MTVSPQCGFISFYFFLLVGNLEERKVEGLQHLHDGIILFQPIIVSDRLGFH